MSNQNNVCVAGYPRQASSICRLIPRRGLIITVEALHNNAPTQHWVGGGGGGVLAGQCSFFILLIHPFLYKNIFYKNIKAAICKILRIFQE